jgi:hypothetical protein
MNKLIYLANSYTSRLPDPVDASLERAQRRLLESAVGLKIKQKYGVTLILPIALSAAMADFGLLDTGFDQWAQDDLTFISKCDEVWVMLSDGWDTSYGVREEIKFAHANRIPVKYIDITTLLFNTNILADYDL